jgi:hypothetical protein
MTAPTLQIVLMICLAAQYPGAVLPAKIYVLRTAARTGVQA